MLNSSAPAIKYSVEESRDFSAWSAIDMTANLISGPTDQGDGTALVTYRGNNAIGSNSDLLRLRVTEQ